MTASDSANYLLPCAGLSSPTQGEYEYIAVHIHTTGLAGSLQGDINSMKGKGEINK